MSKNPSGPQLPTSESSPRRPLRRRGRRHNADRPHSRGDLRPRNAHADSPLATLEIGADEAAKIDELVLPEDLLKRVEEASARVGETRELLERALERADHVRPEIHERVTGDYRSRLRHLEQEYGPLEAEVLERLSSIRHEAFGLRDSLAGIQDQDEELTFRHGVGEFSDEELAERLAALDVDRREVALKVELCESAFEDARRVLLCDPEAVLNAKDGKPDGLLESAAANAAMAEDEVLETLSAPERSAAEDPTAITQLDLDPLDLETKEELPDVVLPEPMGSPKNDSQDSPAEELASEAVAVEDVAADDVVAPPVADEAGVAFARLIRTRPDGESWSLEGGAVSLGRSRRNDVVIPGQTVSREHAIIRPYGDSHQIENVSSSAGVLINGEPRVRANLEPGDQILIGSWLFEYRPADRGA